MAPQDAKCSFHCGGRLVIVLLVLSVAVDQVQSQDETRQMLMGLFEAALMNNSYSEVLWKLQQIYFNPDSKQSPGEVCLSVSVIVDAIKDPLIPYYCQNGPAFEWFSDFNSWQFNSYYELQLSDGVSDTSQLANLMIMSGSTSMFYTFDPSFYTIMKTLSRSTALSIPYVGDIDNFNSYYESDRYAMIHIFIDTELNEMPCWDIAVYALRSVLMWAKAYARANINDTLYCNRKEETDRSSVSNGVRFDDPWTLTDRCQSHVTSVLTEPSNTWILVLCTFYFLNLLVLTSTLINFRKVFLWLQRQGKQIKTLYKASAIVLTCVNIIALITDLYIIVSEGKALTDELYATIIILLPAKVPLVLFILILETPVVCFNTSILNQANQMNTRCQRFAHAFAFCQIIWFVHRLVNDAIISVMYFVLAPAQTLGVITLLLSTIGSAIAFTAIPIYNFKGCNRKTCTSMICVILNGLMICGFFFVITILYVVLVDNGLKAAGMGGLILSLVPPVTVFIIGLIINQKYLKSTAASVTARSEPGEPNQTTAIQVDDDDEEENANTPLLRMRSHP